MKKRTVSWVVGLMLGGLVAGELLARFYFGLGDPPLTVPDSEIEYLFAANQDVYPFGNRQLYNEYSMRSIPLSEVTSERRVLVLGDSVLNGGNLTDQSELATTIASDESVFFGNVSAGSWGPANMAAWLDRYGFLGADTAILLLSSHDLTDLPRFEALNPDTHPTEPTLSALVEGVTRYAPRYFQEDKEPEPPVIDPQDEIDGREVVEDFIDRIVTGRRNLCLVQHLTQTELGAGLDARHHILKQVFEQRGVPVLQLSDTLRTRGYRDDIHINTIGQRLLVRYLQRCAAIARVPRTGESGTTHAAPGRRPPLSALRGFHLPRRGDRWL